MYTLLCLLILWGIISFVKIRKICKSKRIEFNMFECGIINYMGFLIGGIASIGTTLSLIIKYLP